MRALLYAVLILLALLAFGSCKSGCPNCPG